MAKRRAAHHADHADRRCCARWRFGWQQETLAESAREVQKLGAELYDRLRVMTGHMQTLQRSLTSSVEAYNKAVGSLESRVLVSARKFPGLGVVGGEAAEIAELSPIEAAPRHLQAVETERRRGATTGADHPGAARGRGQHRHVRPEPPTGRSGEQPRRTLPGCCTSTAPIAPTPWSSMLADLVADPLDDPMTPEVVSVPDAGHRALAHASACRPTSGHGRARTTACAPTSTSRFRGRLVSSALALAAGIDPKADPWLPERAVWPLMEVVEEHFDDPWLAPLAQHIRNSETVGGVEALLEHPPRRRPLRPLRGAPPRHAAALGGGLRAARDEAAWQVELWRLLRERIGQPEPGRAPASTPAARCARSPTSSTCRHGSRCSA